MAFNLFPLFVRRWFNRAFSNGEAFDYAALDAMHADYVERVNNITALLRQITTASGTLRYDIIARTAFTATSGQTSFVVPTYSTTYDFVVAYFGTAAGLQLIDPALITKTDATHVTLPAQLVGGRVVIETWSPGNGTTQLASTTISQGASLVGINDAGALLTATTVEGALQELASNLASAAYLAGVLTLSNYTKKDGTVAFTGNQSMGGHKLTNLAAGTADSNDAARMADITSTQLQSILGTFLAATYLAISGGTMAGDLSMGTHSITDIANGADPQDAVSKAQLDLKLSLAGGTMTGDIDADGNTVTGLADAVADTDAVPLAQARGLVSSFSRIADYVVAGADTFIVPAGVSRIRVRMWGGGAGGANGAPGSGGFGAGYGEAFLDVVAAESLTLGIGAAGSSGSGAGGASTIARGASVLLRAGGGTISAGGVATSPAGEDFLTFTGGQPGPIGALSGGILAHGQGGAAPQGGSGGQSTYTTGSSAGADGTFPGGGGAGGASGGQGGVGRVIINY